MRFKENPFRESGRFAAPSTAALAFHRTLRGYAPTALVDCQALAETLGVRSLHVKDESHRFGLNSFKALGASYAMSRISAVTFSAATAGNHGRAVAWSARRLSRKLAGGQVGNLPHWSHPKHECRAKIFVPALTSPARIETIREEGADVRVVDGSYEDAVRLCDRESREHGWQVISDVGYEGYMEIPKWVVEGYETLFLEIEDLQPDVVFIQAGVGGLLSAAAQHFQGPQIVSVEPESADCLLESICAGEPSVSKGAQNSIMAGLNCSEVSLTAWPSIRRGVDLFVAIEDRLTIEAMSLLAGAGIDSGESGAAGLAGLLALRDRFQGARVLVVNTEGQCT